MYLTTVADVQGEMIRRIEQGIVRIEPDIQSANGVDDTAVIYRNTASRVGYSHFVVFYLSHVNTAPRPVTPV